MMMTRYSTVLAIVACALLLMPYEAKAATDRIAFLDLEKVFSEYHKTQAADAQLRRQAEEFNVERREMIVKLEELREEHNSLREDAINEALDPQVRAAREEEAETKTIQIREQEERIRRFDELRTKQLEDQGRRMRRNIVEEIREIINDHARERGYAAVIDSSGQSLNGVTTVLYLDSRHDITNDVIALLNN